ncbi:MAG: aminoglycoside phosphotransferase family protein [Acidobacteriota bacterium]
MSLVLEISDVRVSTEALQPVLAQQMGEHFGSPRTIVRLTRRPSEYHSSYPIEELNVVLADGTSLDLIFKNLSESALLAGAQAAKPQLIRNPRREIEVYRQILSDAKLGTPILYGARTDDHNQEYWLFIEDVPGLELYQIGDISAWQEAARWLARMHVEFAGRVSQLENNPTLLKRDGHFYRTWIRRAEEFAQSDPLQARNEIQRLLSGFESVVERITRLSRTLIHGEFYASNILVEQASDGVRVCPVDWEMAGVGPGLMDLAALMSGNWTDNERREIARAYHQTMTGSDVRLLTESEFWTALDYCRLALAIQWLGWSRSWTPPLEHQHDWRTEALELSAKLGIG